MTMHMRIPIIRVLADGTITDGTARLSDDRWIVDDFRDLNGEPLNLPSGAFFRIPAQLGEKWEKM